MSLFDENASVLKQLAENGADLSRPRSVNFEHNFRNEASAQTFADTATLAGFSVQVRAVERLEWPWDVTASKQLDLTCENISAVELQLKAMAETYGGNSDGWGFLED